MVTVCLKPTTKKVACQRKEDTKSSQRDLANCSSKARHRQKVQIKAREETAEIGEIRRQEREVISQREVD